MKNIITLIMVMMLSLSPSLSFSTERHKPVKCFPFEDFYELMERKFGEKPTFLLNNTLDGSTTISLLINREEGNWTLVEHNKSTVCILGMGKMPTT